MNVHEVIARLASCALEVGPVAQRRVHPNDDVNLGQSSNDVFPTAMHIATVLRSRPLLVSLAGLRAALRGKAEAFGTKLKIGRNHLQDAAPITFSQEFGGYEAQLALAEAAIRRAWPDVHAPPPPRAVDPDESNHSVAGEEDPGAPLETLVASRGQARLPVADAACRLRPSGCILPRAAVGMRCQRR